jgi:hypothetical protein
LIREVAHVNVLEGHQVDFERDLSKAVTEILTQATGLIGTHFDGPPVVEHFSV